MIRKFLNLILLTLAFAWSCTEEDNMDPIGNWEMADPVPGAPAADADIILDENKPDSVTRFEWEPAATSNRFIVAYRFLLLTAESDDLTDPLLEIVPANGGKDQFVQPTAQQIDYALWAACYPAGEKVNLKWAVVAKAIDKEAVATQNVTFTRFETDYMPSTLYITGAATEAGANPENATLMRAQKNSEGALTHVFDVYTTLTEGETFQFRDQANTRSRLYGGSEGELEGCGAAIAAPETGQYRITVDLNTNTYELLKIDRWSLVGDAVAGGWGGDVPLAYKGNGVWEDKIEFYRPYDGAGFIFRANGDWGYLIKRIKGTATPDNNGGDVIMESEGAGAGVEFEDMPGPDPAIYTVTLDLSAEGYTYSLVEEISGEPEAAIIGETTNPDADGVSGSFEFGSYDVPDQLFLLSDGDLVAEFTKDGNVFSSEIFVALEESKTYILNDANDGSGTTYNELGDGTIAVARDQAYRINVDFEAGELSWKYYNMKLFHWDEAGGGWDARQELVMTYIHPYTFEVTGTLSAGYHSKFNSPWEVEFGTDDTALSGTMTHGGPNFKGIVQNGTYKAVIEVASDYSECTDRKSVV